MKRPAIKTSYKLISQFVARAHSIRANKYSLEKIATIRRRLKFVVDMIYLFHCQTVNNLFAGDKTSAGRFIAKFGKLKRENRNGYLWSS